MATIYAKNPAELVIQNPAKKPKTKQKKKMARKKRNAKGRFTSKRKNPAGPASEFTETGKNLFMRFGLAALAATGVAKGVSVGVAKLDLPTPVKDALIIGGPAAGGILVSMLTGKNNAIAQGIAGGMVLASVNTASDRFIGGRGSVDGLSDTDMIVKSDGVLYDQDGNAIAKIALPGSENGNGRDHGQRVLEEAFSTIDKPGNMLGEFDGSFEGGEVWTP